MKKYLFLIFTFIFILTSSLVSAKSVEDEEIVVHFGNGDKLDLGYSSINKFKIENKSFYFNEVKYTFNDDYSLVNGSIVVEEESKTFTMLDDTFTIDLENNVVNSEKIYQTYMFDVEIDILINKEYDFTQEICYSYNSKSEVCNIDKGDKTTISRDESYHYYYDFLPFYDDSIIFDNIKYKFTFNDGNKDILKEISFSKEEINYKDSFELIAFPSTHLSYNSSSYKGKDYIQLGYYNASYEQFGLYRYYMFFNIVSFNTLDEDRIYDVNVYLCLPLEIECQTLNGETPIEVSSKSNVNNLFSLSLESLLMGETKYDHFTLKADYVYNRGNDDYSRRQTTKAITGETTIYISDMDLNFKGTLEGVRDGNAYLSNKEVTNTILFEQRYGVEKVYYLLSNKAIDDPDLINNEIENGNEITFGNNLEGYYYLYFKVFDGSGFYLDNIKRPVYYLFDVKGPSINSNNFDEYESSEKYKDVNIKVTYKDDNFIYLSGLYFKVIKESEYDSITKEDIINFNSLYSDGVSIKDYIQEDGYYKVCFVGYDYLKNYTDFNIANDCSNSYYLDISALSKEEVSISSISGGYHNTLNLTIDIKDVEVNREFKCGVFRNGETIEANDITSTCLNGVNNKINFSGEGEYVLWVYASDYVGNYNLIKFEDIYLLDNIAPRINSEIIGTPLSYSNNIKVNVKSEDLNSTNKGFYLFYQGSYENKDLLEFNLDEGIYYPYNYYGEYKLVIKVCDLVNNCSIIANNQIYKIDTGKININLIGEEEIVILRFGKYKENGVDISKGSNNTKINMDYKIEGEVDTSRVGEYLVIYTTGSGMNEVSITRKVIVKDSLPYIYVLLGSLLVGELIIVARLFIKKRKNDSI